MASMQSIFLANSCIINEIHLDHTWPRVAAYKSGSSPEASDQSVFEKHQRSYVCLKFFQVIHSRQHFCPDNGSRI